MVESGTDINALNGDNSFLHNYLNGYYQWHIYHFDAYSQMDIDDVPDEPFPMELTMSLIERPSCVLDHVNWFFEHSANPNCGIVRYPLMCAVRNLDAPMTEYLIQHGADPFFDDKESEPGIPFAIGNWYIDELDIRAFDESFDNAIDTVLFDAILKTASVLAKHGVTSNGLHCISIDAESRAVKLEQACVKF